MKQDRLAAAENTAEHWLKQNGFLTLPIDPRDVAERLDIEVRAKPDADPGVSGMLLRNGDNFGILYATYIPSLGFQNFSIAHEIGHFMLEGHPELLFPEGNGVHSSKANFMSTAPYEREADHFASSLLMPDGLFRSVLRRSDEGLAGIQALREKCVTSMTATAIRYAKKTSIPAAVIVSSSGKVDYAFLSDEMKEFPNLEWLRKGQALPSGTLTKRFATSDNAVCAGRQDEDEIELDLWLGGRKGIRAKEEVLGLGSYGRILTVLTTDLLPEDDADDDMEESWRPRFRR